MGRGDGTVLTGKLLTPAQLGGDLIQHQSKCVQKQEKRQNPWNKESVWKQEEQQNPLDTFHIQGIWSVFVGDPGNKDRRNHYFKL